MDFALTGEQGDLVSAAREFFAARLRPHYRRRDTEGAMDRATLAEMGRLGFFGLEFPAPVVTAVHALAVGGGVALAAAADFCLAARSARFYAAYTGIGLLCDGGSTFLPRRIGVRRTAEFLMRNQTWTAAEALEYGLVTDVLDDADLGQAAWNLAAELARGPRRSFGEIRNLLLSTWEQPIEAQMELEARAMARVCRTDDAWTGIREVAARRIPEFRGR